MELTSDEDFLSRANEVAAASVDNPVEAIAKSFVNDTPKIGIAIKSYLSWLVARNFSGTTDKVEFFAKESPPVIEDSKDLLLCARALLNVINSFAVPEKNGACLEYEILRTLWNKFSVDQEKKFMRDENMKPSKVFGRSALVLVYPTIMAVLSDDLNASKLVVNGLEKGQVLHFFEHFGFLLSRNSDDSMLIWSEDELSKRSTLRKEMAEQRKSGS